jgi:hypothetical protein
VQKAILDQFPDIPFGVTIVWVDMLRADAESAATTSALQFHDPRVRQFYDPHRLMGSSLSRLVFPGYLGKASKSLPEGNPIRTNLESRPADSPLWDIYLFYNTGASWEDTAPRPSHWIKQLMLDSEGRSLLWRDDFARAPRMADLADEIGAAAREWLAPTEIAAPKGDD